MRYRLRTLLVVLALAPPVLAVAWLQYSAWQAEKRRKHALEEMLITYREAIAAARYRQHIPHPRSWHALGRAEQETVWRELAAEMGGRQLQPPAGLKTEAELNEWLIKEGHAIRGQDGLLYGVPCGP